YPGMAQNLVLKVSTSSFLIVLVIALAIILVSQANELTETQSSLHLQDISAGPNATVIPIAGIAGKLWTFAQFGTVFVTDDPIYNRNAGPKLCPDRAVTRHIRDVGTEGRT
ncbi:hypothetical protein TorRG33x02_279890, partial [Trema orientale]